MLYVCNIDGDKNLLMKFPLAVSVNATPFSFFPEPKFVLGLKSFASGSFFSSINAGLS